MAGTLARLGWSDPLTDTFGAHPQLGAVLDLNDGQTYTLLAPNGLELSAPIRTLVPAGNVRTQGETVTRAIYRHNREAKIRVLLGPAASYAALVSTIRTLLGWLNAVPAIPFAVQWQPFGASEPGYLDVVGAAHNIPSDEGQWLRLQVEPVEIVLIVRPGIRYPRQTLSNLAMNPGFTAGGGPGTQVFNDPLANALAYASQAGGAPTAGSVTGTFVDLVMALAPLRYFRLGEAAGTTAYDTSGQGQNGTISGSPTLGAAGSVSGDAGDKAITFAGGAQKIAGADTGLPSGNAAWSVLCAFKIAALPGAFTGFVTWGTNANNQRVEVGITNTNHVYGGFGGGTSAAQGGTPSTGGYHLVVCTFDGTNLRLYLDGSLVAGPTAATGAVVLSSLQLGQFFAGTATTLNGQLDEVAIFGTALSAGNVTTLYTAWNAGTGLPTSTNVLTLASGARASFGSPNWAAINTWQTRFRYTAGGDYRFYLHYTDANNWLRARLQATSLTLEHNIGGVTTTLATQTVAPASNTWYWLRCTQFPVPSGGGGTPDPACVQAVLLSDANGSVGAAVATAGPVATQDAVTALSGRPQLEASGQSLIIGGNVSNQHSVSLFGPGGWTFQGNDAAAPCSGAWEQDTTKTYPSGPLTGYGAARIDLPPAGAIDASWRLYTGGSPTGQLGAVAVASAGDTLGFRVRYASTGLSGSASVRAFIREYDASGALLRTGAAQSGGNTAGAWATLQNLSYVTGASCAYVDLALRVVDAMAGASAGGSVWFDNVQIWNVTKSGQADMPYCELRFPQSPAQLLLTGIVGDLPAPAQLSFGTYMASFAPANALSFGIGRLGRFSPSAQLVGHVHGFYGSALSPQAIAVLDSTAFWGYYVQALVQASWNPRCFSFKTADLRGIFHLLGRFLTKQLLGNLANVQLRVTASQQIDPWFNKSDQSDVLSTYYGPFAALFAASNAWTVADAGQMAIPPYPQGALTDPSALYHVPRVQWQDLTGGGSNGQTDWELLLPIDGSLVVGVVNNPSNGAYTVANSWIWSYFDGLLINRAAVGDGPSWTYSLETSSLAAPSKGAGGPGTQNTGFVNVNSGADPYLIVDPTIGSSAWPGANQLGAYITDASGTVLPFVSEVSYAPLYLWPR